MGIGTGAEHRVTEVGKGTAKPTAREVMKLLPEVGRSIQQSLPLSVLHEGVSTAQVKALVQLAEGGPQTMGDLAAALRITTPSATGLINPLAEMGYVVRERSERDRRVVWVRLSERAEELAEEVMRERDAEVSAALEGMSPEAQADLLEGLRRLSDHFGDPKRRGVRRAGRLRERTTE